MSLDLLGAENHNLLASETVLAQAYTRDGRIKDEPVDNVVTAIEDMWLVPKIAAEAYTCAGVSNPKWVGFPGSKGAASKALRYLGPPFLDLTSSTKAPLSKSMACCLGTGTEISVLQTSDCSCVFEELGTIIEPANSEWVATQQYPST